MTIGDVVFGTCIGGLGRTLDWSFYLICLPCVLLPAAAAVGGGPPWAALGANLLGACLLPGLIGVPLVPVRIEKHGAIW
jgi:hypothetical protein